MTVVIFITSLLAAMALGMPIAFALIVCGIALMLYMGNFDAQIVAQNMVSGADSFALLAVPFFLFAGNLMVAGGISQRIVTFANALVGHYRGGLGYVAIFTAVLLASVSGSAIADTAALTSLLLPLMVKHGYNKERSAGLLAAGGIIAPIIPPSLAFIVFGVAANLSITKLFLAGIAPGVMMGLVLVVTWWIVSRRDTGMRVEKPKSWKEVGVAFKDAFWALLLPIVIIGGLKMGIFTPTETGAVLCFLALFIGFFVYRELKISMLYEVALNSAKATAVVMFLVAAALVSSWLITVADLAGELSVWLEPLLDNQTLFMIAVMVLVILIGTALDLVPTVLILTPILMPLVKQAGIDPIYFGVLFIINNAIGLLTPPVGTVLNVVAGTGGISMDRLIRGVWPFLIAQVVLLFLFVFFPALITVPMHWFF